MFLSPCDQYGFCCQKVILEPENELLGDVEFAGNISSNDSESQDQSDGDSQSEVEEESEWFTL